MTGLADDSPAPSPRPEISFVAVLNAALRGRRLIARLVAGLFGLVVLVTLLASRSYTSSVIFVPQAEGGALAALTGVAAQLGVSVPLKGSGQSADFYAALVRCREIEGKLVDTEFRFTAVRGLPFFKDTVVLSGTLVSLLEIDGDSPAQERDMAIERLDRMLSASTGLQTGMVTVSISTEWPGLSEAVMQRLLVLVNSFNLRTRQSRAAAERQFVQARVEQVRAEMVQAEERLQAFLQRNRQYQNAPHLLFEHDRLAQDLELRRQIVLTLSQSFEQARIEEVRDTPVITVVQPAWRPARPDRRHLLLKGLAALMVAAFAGVAITVVQDTMQRGGGAKQDEIEELHRITSEMLAELQRRLRWPWRRSARQAAA